MVRQHPVSATDPRRRACPGGLKPGSPICPAQSRVAALTGPRSSPRGAACRARHEFLRRHHSRPLCLHPVSGQAAGPARVGALPRVPECESRGGGHGRRAHRGGRAGFWRGSLHDITGSPERHGLPIALGIGGAAARKPLGIAIIGGLVVSQLLTLYITPVIYLLLEKVSSWGRKDQSQTAAAKSLLDAAA
jgi:hypothetical protein